MDYTIPTPEEQYKGPDLRQQHNKRSDAGVLPRDGDTSRDQGKNNMTPEPCLEEKTMRKTGGESQVLKKQAGFCNNVGGSAKAKTGVDNRPTGNIDTSLWPKKDDYNGVLVGGDINQYYDMLSSKQKEDGRKTQHDPDASNTNLNVGGTNSVPHDQKEKKGRMLISNERTDDGKTIGVLSENVADPLMISKPQFQGENTASPTIPSDEKEEKGLDHSKNDPSCKSQPVGHENATFDINVPQTTPSNEKEKQGTYYDPSKRNATEEVQTSSYRPGKSSATSPNNSPSKIAPHHDQEKEHQDDGPKSHPDPSRKIANGSEGTKDVQPPYLISQSEGGCSPCCSSCSVL